MLDRGWEGPHAGTVSSLARQQPGGMTRLDEAVRACPARAGSSWHAGSRPATVQLSKNETLQQIPVDPGFRIDPAAPGQTPGSLSLPTAAHGPAGLREAQHGRLHDVMDHCANGAAPSSGFPLESPRSGVTGCHARGNRCRRSRLCGNPVGSFYRERVSRPPFCGVQNCEANPPGAPCHFADVKSSEEPNRPWHTVCHPATTPGDCETISHALQGTCPHENGQIGQFSDPPADFSQRESGAIRSCSIVNPHSWCPGHQDPEVVRRAPGRGARRGRYETNPSRRRLAQCQSRGLEQGVPPVPDDGQAGRFANRPGVDFQRNPPSGRCHVAPCKSPGLRGQIGCGTA